MKRFQDTLFPDRQGVLRYFNHNPMVPQTPGNLDLEARRVPVGGFTETDAIVRSEPLTGAADWRELTMTLPPLPNRDFIRPLLRVKGRGTALFKDLLLEYTNRK